MGRSIKSILALSLLLNLLFIVMAGYEVHKKGLGYFISKVNANAPVAYVPAPEWHYRKSMFDSYPMQPNAAVFAGDSITEINDWEKAFPQAAVYNEGINADTTDGVLLRIGDITRLHPSKVFLMIGVNDILFYSHSTVHVVQNDRQIINDIRAQSPSTHIYLESILPINQQKLTFISPVKNQANSMIQTLDSGLQTLARNEGCTFIDLRPAFTANGQLNPAWTIDGLHFDQDGYSALEGAISKYL